MQQSVRFVYLLKINDFLLHWIDYIAQLVATHGAAKNQPY